jgi:ADP-dependent NAD(P)H-hydrate dehydratase / NAD(P)H-hydrate epimerase
VVYSGPELATGASRLAAGAALGVGAGLVSLLGTPAALSEHANHVTAVMLKQIDANFTAIDDRVAGLAIGPGAGVGHATCAAVQGLLARDIPIVIDADGLTSFENQPLALFDALHGHAVLTPHEGEFKRLFPDIDLTDRAVAAKEAALRSRAVILLKGAQTVIASPDGRCAINQHSAPWLATAGSGDVLTGIICGLLAQGIGSFDAACMSAWLHGDIGIRHGPGLTADRMLAQLPLVLRGCLKA